MKLAAVVPAFLLVAGGAAAQETAERVVARVFGAAITAADLRWGAGRPAVEAVQALRSRMQKEATERFVAANDVQATEQDFAAFEKFEAEFARLERERRAAQKKKLETELAVPGLDAGKRTALEQQREVLASLERVDAERVALQTDPQTRRRISGPWITGYKANRALYEKYGGRVGITKWGPEPVGAMEALLREHERRGEFAILDAALAEEFWAWYAAQPRMAARPAEVDFTYYWLKPARAGNP